ncbi:MAG: hypothetical protein K2N22_06635, partial [Clostridia bacterium]|nr:hypothetical protein [Clostridia bacterium]
YKLVFKVTRESLSWGIPYGSKEEIFREVEAAACERCIFNGGEKPFKISAPEVCDGGVFLTLAYQEKTLTLKLGEPQKFEYRYDFESFSDCNTYLYTGTVILKKTKEEN